MRTFLVAASALAAGTVVFSRPPLASAAVIVVVEAGTVTTVDTEESLFDSRLLAAGGCDPAGCSGDKTRVSSLQEERAKLRTGPSSHSHFFHAAVHVIFNRFPTPTPPKSEYQRAGW